MGNIVESLYRTSGARLNESKSSYKVNVKLPKDASIVIEVRRPGGPDPAMRGIDYRHISIDDSFMLPINIALCDGDLIYYIRKKLQSYFTKFVKENNKRAKFSYLGFDVKDCFIIDVDGKEYDIRTFIDLHRDFIESTELKSTELATDFYNTFADASGNSYKTKMFGGDPESGRIYVHGEDLDSFERFFTEHGVDYKINHLFNSKYIDGQNWYHSIQFPKSAFISK